jgi:hypothetical protein
MLPSGAMVTPVPPSPTLPELDDGPPDELEVPLLLLAVPPPPLLEFPLLLLGPPLLPLPPELLPPLDELGPVLSVWPFCVGWVEEQPRTTVSNAKAAVVVIFMVKLTP